MEPNGLNPSSFFQKAGNLLKQEKNGFVFFTPHPEFRLGGRIHKIVISTDITHDAADEGTGNTAVSQA